MIAFVFRQIWEGTNYGMEDIMGHGTKDPLTMKGAEISCARCTF